MSLDTARDDAPVRRPTSRVQVVALGASGARTRPDRLATEEPMEIRVHGPGEPPTPLVVTMRTPGNDFELAAGFCLTEGVITEPAEIASVAYCLGSEGEQFFNVVTIALVHPVVASLRERRFVSNASCGLCGKTALDDIEVRCAPVADGPVIAAATVFALPERLGASQSVFEVTGGLHAAAVFTAAGELVTLREDIGRHNALDKLIGDAVLTRRLPLAESVLMVSGRLGFELVQKAAVAGIPILCAVSAPSSLAVKTAQRFGQTLVGFVRDDRANVYTHPERVAVDR